jgi:hypothetical protein
MSEIVVPSSDQFAKQQQIHNKIHDKIKEIVGDFDLKHATISEKMSKEHAAHYDQWWQDLRHYLLQHADVHKQLGDHLNTAATLYYGTEEQITKVMQQIEK